MTDPQLFDPFGERSPGAWSRQLQLQLLGGRFEFRSDSEELLALVDLAYRGLPAHRMSADAAPDFQIELRLTEGRGLAGLNEPPEARMQGGAGFLCVLMDAANLALAFPESRRGLVAISREMLLRFPYHARYELIEFVVFTLASRAQELVPLHAGCIGTPDGRGALLVGESGAGKSTLSLHCMLQGLDFLTEDASFVAPQDLSVTGVANFLHLRFDALGFLDDELRARAAASPVIRRRSGVEKYELDLRQGWARLAPAALRLEHIVMVSKEPAQGGPLLSPLAPDELLARLTRSQPYAAHQPSWPLFAEKVQRLHGGHQLRRGSHPREAAEALRGLLMAG